MTLGTMGLIGTLNIWTQHNDTQQTLSGLNSDTQHTNTEHNNVISVPFVVKLNVVVPKAVAPPCDLCNLTRIVQFQWYRL
jgi:hypothetical protein